MDLAKSRVVPVIGLNYKDKPQEAKAWLKQFGDPYMLSVMDQDGRVGIDYGVYGVPETFVIDRAGVVRYKQHQCPKHPLPARRGLVRHRDARLGRVHRLRRRGHRGEIQPLFQGVDDDDRHQRAGRP